MTALRVWFKTGNTDYNKYAKIISLLYEKIFVILDYLNLKSNLDF